MTDTTPATNEQQRALIAALLLTRDTLANLTTEQFSHGEDKPAREAIDAALLAVGIGPDVTAAQVAA